MSQDLVDDLKAAFPDFVYKNRLNVPKSLFLAEGEEIVVPGNGVASVASSKINSFPDFATFEYVSPKLSDLEHYGMLERKTAEENTFANVAKAEPTYTPSPGTIEDRSSVDPRAAGNNTVTSPTSSPSIDTKANLSTKLGSDNKTGQ